MPFGSCLHLPLFKTAQIPSKEIPLSFEWPLSSIVWFVFFWPCNTPCGLWDLSPDQGSNSCPLQWKLEVLTTGIPIFRVKAEHPPLWFDCCVLSPTLSPVTCVTLHTSACLEWALSSPGPAELVRHTVLGPTPSLSDSVGLRWSQNLALVRYF